MRGAARDERLGRGDRLERERQETVQIGVPMQPGALDREGPDSGVHQQGREIECGAQESCPVLGLQLWQHNTYSKLDSKDGLLTGRMQFSYLQCSIEVLERR